MPMLVVLGLFAMLFFPGPYYPWSKLTSETQGVVVSFDNDEDCLPTVEYDVGGSTWESSPDIRVSACEFEMGGVADVRYDPDYPWNAEVLPNGVSRYLLTLIPLATWVGLALAILACLVLIPYDWVRKRRTH